MFVAGWWLHILAHGEANILLSPRKNYYRDDPVYHDKVLERSKKEYKKHRQRMHKLTDEERQVLRELNSYSNLMPGWSGGMGTSGVSTNLSIVEVDGQKRVKGMVWLEEEILKIKERNKKGKV